MDFLRAASHELKTPVTALNAILENMILGVGKYKDYNLYLPKCKILSEQLGQMIRDILDTSKINFFADDVSPCETHINELITDFCLEYQTIAKSKGQIFQINSEKTLTASISQNLFCKALSNILNNAILYTHPGGKITVSLEDNTLLIENECIPIPEEHLKHIFEPFYRPEYSRDRNTGGNGLGLYFTATMLKRLNLSFNFCPSPSNNSMQFKIIFKSVPLH